MGTRVTQLDLKIIQNLANKFRQNNRLCAAGKPSAHVGMNFPVRALVLSSLVQWDGTGAPTSAGPAALTSGISIGTGGCCTGLAGHWLLSGDAQMILYPKHFLQEKKRSFE